MFNKLFKCISQKKKHILLKRFKLYMIFTGILLIAMVVFFETQIVPFENKCVEKESRSVAIKIINKSVQETLDNNKFTYADLAKVNYSNNGKVNSIETNSISVNEIKSEINMRVQKKLDNDKLYYFSVPVGAFTKLNELNSIGPDLEINFRLTGSSKCKLKSSFESAGVNQTIHHIYVVVTAEIITISPEYSKTIKISTDYEIAQTVILGDTPNMYVTIDK